MNSAKILIAEDDAFLREMYKDVLTFENYTIETSVDGEDAYQKLKAGGWDLVLMDMLMPKLTGLEVVKKVNQERETPATKHLFFLTNLEDKAEMDEAKELGEAYLIKSTMNPGELVAKIKEALRK